MSTVFDNFTLQIHGGGNHGGVAGSVEQFLSFIETLFAKEPAEIFSVILPGLSNMPNIHPLLVHFPIALLTSFFIIDLLGSLNRNDDLRRTAGWFLYLGTVGAIATVFAGYQAADSIPHGQQVHEIMMQHKNYGLTVASLATILTLWRFLARGHFGSATSLLHLFLTGIMCIVMYLGADLGGMMVFRYGVGVSNSTVPTTITHGHGHNHNDHSH